MRRTQSNQTAASPAQSSSLANTGAGEADKENKPRSQLLTKRTRTITDKVDHKYRSSTEKSIGSPNLPGPDVAGTTRIQPDGWRSDEASTKEKNRPKGVSFLSRLLPNNKSKTRSSEDLEDESEATDQRPEGMDAQLFSYTGDNIGFNPRYPHPPNYIKVRAKYKKEREFDRLFLAQELRPALKRKRDSVDVEKTKGAVHVSNGAHPNAIWALEFSMDGKYLAAGGQDKVISVWTVLSTPEERRTYEKEEEDEANGNENAQRLRAPVFQRKVFREYTGHEAAVMDLNWSKNSFLLSSSLDKSVRLWHPSRPECLCVFKHNEPVLSLKFHPRDDRFFLAGCRDSKLRLWSIPDKNCPFTAQLPEVITAVSFTPDGKTALAGTISGVCHTFEVPGLKPVNQLLVRSSHGKNARGSKICSIQSISFSGSQDSSSSNTKLLMSSADSRIRLYNFRSQLLDSKFKGHEAEELSIRASATDDRRYVVSGSEDRGAYIWSLDKPPVSRDKPNLRPVEYFEASSAKTTAVLFAPTTAKQLLAKSEDPIYDLCNPPPVTLMSRSESVHSSRPATESGSINDGGHGSGHSGSGPGSLTTPKHPSQTPKLDSVPKKAPESNAYKTRSAHPNGNIIVTASCNGAIRVYRQDCAFRARARHASDLWETSSMWSGKGQNAKKPSAAYMARAMSIHSRGSGGSGPLGAPSRRRTDSQASISTQPAGERILSWRQGVSSSTASLTDARAGPAARQSSAASSASAAPPRHRNRSSSPRKTAASLSRKPAAPPDLAALPALTLTTSPEALAGPATAPPPRRSPDSDADSDSDDAEGPAPSTVAPQSTTTAAADVGSAAAAVDNPLWLQGGRSFMFWNAAAYPAAAASGAQAALAVHARRPSLEARKESAVSMLSSEGGDASAREEERRPERACAKCGGRRFRVVVRTGGRADICERCGSPAP